MKYYLTRTVDGDMVGVIERVTQKLKEQGFGVLTDIDVRATLKKKLDVDFREYRILGACNPSFAYKALTTEPDIGVMLPCNVVIQNVGEGKMRVSAINPMESMKAVNNKELEKVATEVASRLKLVVESL
jgi:uncharacterized protein (DUF302 family)